MWSNVLITDQIPGKYLHVLDFRFDSKLVEENSHWRLFSQAKSLSDIGHLKKWQNQIYNEKKMNSFTWAKAFQRRSSPTGIIIKRKAFFSNVIHDHEFKGKKSFFSQEHKFMMCEKYLKKVAQIKSALFHSTLFSFGCLQYTVVANIFKELFKFSVLIFLLLKFAHTWISSIWRLCRKWLSTIVACVESWCDLLAKGQWTYLLPADIEPTYGLCF